MKKLSPDEKGGRFNKKIVELIKSGFFYELGITYYQMADFVKKEGKDDSYLRDAGYKIKLKIHQEELIQWENGGVVANVEILDAGDTSCMVCQKLNKKRLSIDDAISTMILPVKECGHKYGCRCVYLPIVE